MGSCACRGEDASLVPVDDVSGCPAVMREGRLDVSSVLVDGVVVPVAGFVLFHPFGDRSVGLPIIETVAVFAGCFVDGVGSEVRGRRGLRLCEDVAYIYSVVSVEWVTFTSCCWSIRLVDLIFPV